MPIFLFMIKVIPFIYEDLDDLYANTYLLIDEESQCVVIDPAKNYQGLVNYVVKNNLKLKGILITHGHADHMRGIDCLVDAYNAPVYIGFDDADKLTDKYGNCSMLLGEILIIKAKGTTVADNEVLHLLKEDILVINTPYHTAGSVCYYLKDSGVCFTGDFILPHGIGRSDLPDARPRELARSMAKITSLPKETKIYGGHGKPSTLEMELRVNPFVK